MPTPALGEGNLTPPHATFGGESPPSGTMHPILARLEALGWLESSWEHQESTHQQGSHLRR
jgi:hypothetical protein